jgi:hypothetical protein
MEVTALSNDFFLKIYISMLGARSGVKGVSFAGHEVVLIEAASMIHP